MTEEELRKNLMMYEVFLRTEEEDKEEPEMDEEGSFVDRMWEYDDEDNWLWEENEDGSWHRTGFNQVEFDRFVERCVFHREEELRRKYHLKKPK